MKPVLLATDGSPTATKAAETRRRQIGTLRALGFPAQSVGRSFAIEAAYVALQVTFAVPYVQLAVLLVGTVLASLAATIAPALSATRIRPAVALRMTD